MFIKTRAGIRFRFIAYTFAQKKRWKLSFAFLLDSTRLCQHVKLRGHDVKYAFLPEMEVLPAERGSRVTQASRGVQTTFIRKDVETTSPTEVSMNADCFVGLVGPRRLCDQCHGYGYFAAE